MNPIEFGARQAVVNCLKVKRGEKVVVITDRETEKMADAIIAEAKKVGGEVQKFIMGAFGPRPDDGKNPLKFPEAIASALSNAHVSFYIACGRPGELNSFRRPMLKIVQDKKVRHGHMPDFTEEMVGTGMAADYAEIQKLCKRVYDIVSKAREIHVTSPAGTDVLLKFNPEKYRWFICDGDIKPGKWSNLPDGEVFGYPFTADGKVVVDGCFGDFLTKKYNTIENTPLSYELKNGRCVRESVTCKNSALKKEFEEYTFCADEKANRAGEFGIGTNIGLTKLIGNMLQDEKIPGAHIALGDPSPEDTGAEWECSKHNDGIIKNPTIVVDGKPIMKDGKFTIL